jgi:hypothetical protein
MDTVPTVQVETMGVHIACLSPIPLSFTSTPVRTFEVVYQAEDSPPAMPIKTFLGPEVVYHANDSPLSIPTQIGLPLWQLSHTQLPMNPEKERKNCIVGYLSVSAVPATSSINSGNGDGTPLSWQEAYGSKVMMRQDGFNLLPQHVIVLYHFCKDMSNTTVRYAGKPGDKRDKLVQQRERFQEVATRANFEMYYRRFCDREVANDPRWRNLPSPYDLAQLGKKYTNVPANLDWTERRSDRSHSESTISMDEEVGDDVWPPV